AGEQPRGYGKARELHGCIADVQPREFVRRRMDIAHDVAAADCKQCAGDRFCQARDNDTRNQPRSACVFLTRRVGRCHHDVPPDRISPRADSPGTSRPGSGLRTRRILTGTRWTTRTKLPVALSEGIRLKAAPLPGAKLSTTPSIAMSE